MASSPESYAVEREFAESMVDPFEAILELRARVAELEARESEVEATANRIDAEIRSRTEPLKARVAEQDSTIAELLDQVEDAVATVAIRDCRVAEIESKVTELITSMQRCGVAVGGHATDSPDEVACRVEARVAELEVERAAIMGISQDCDGAATTPLEVFNELLKALESDAQIVDLVCKIMGNGTMVVETINESLLVKMLEMRGTPIPLDPDRTGRNVDEDWAREQAYLADQSGEGGSSD